MPCWAADGCAGGERGFGPALQLVCSMSHCDASALGPLTMPVHCPCHTIQLQANDVEAAEQALLPAWAALDVNVHKQERDGTPAFLRQFDAGRADFAVKRHMCSCLCCLLCAGSCSA